MTRKNIIELFITLIIFLFLYTAISKFKEFDVFEASMRKQKVPDWSKPILIWAVPIGEILVSLCLMYETLMPKLVSVSRLPQQWASEKTAFRFRMTGLYGALVLMTMFTVYVALAVFKVFEHKPCSCGGVIQKLGWNAHLVLNTAFLLMTIAAIYLSLRKPNNTDAPQTGMTHQLIT